MLALWQSAAGGGLDDPLPPSATGYGVQLVRSVVALIGVCLAAWWVLRQAARRGIGRAAGGRDVRVRERVVLDARRSVYLVEVGGRALLLGASEGASLNVLAEFKREELDAARAAAANAAGEPEAGAARGGVAARFSEVLARIRGGGGGAGDGATSGDAAAAGGASRGDVAGTPAAQRGGTAAVERDGDE